MNFENPTNSQKENIDQLLDKLNSLDKNAPDYQTRLAAIEQQIKDVNQIDQSLDALELQAEARLAEFDQIDNLLEQLEDLAEKKFSQTNLADMTTDSPELNAEQNMAAEDNEIETPAVETPVDPTKLNNLRTDIAIAMRNLIKNAQFIKDALKSTNILSRPKLSAEEKSDLNYTVEKMLNKTILDLADYDKTDIDSANKTLSAINQAIFDIQTQAEAKNIRTPLL